MTAPLAAEDVRDLLGMRTNYAWAVLATYIAAMTIVAVYQFDVVTNPVLLVAGLTVFSAAAIVVVRMGDDPLPTRLTVLLVLSGPLGCALILSATPALDLSSLLFTWIHGGGTAVYCFMTVRGRYVAPWLGLVLMIVVCAVWAYLRHLSVITACALVAVDAAPLFMSLMFAMMLRPTARTVFALRNYTIERIAQASADDAAADERSRQADRLNSLARPLLGRIASGNPLTDDERGACAALEAHLRDQLRAPLLAHLGLDVAAFNARNRGVEVVLIDDSAAGDAESSLNPDVIAALQDRALKALDAATAGQIFVRISAPDRPIAASVLVRPESGDAVRAEITPDGMVREFR
ncbi:hypothetical protein HH308_28100 [Gordonia sp. TBRC 11910]|uniref:Signal transduction histidine kinase n=1 Tax=Gordonia asplenii TaxID=2725283 RepID=A0A848L245_9ACTN|nr:hypothetical protein [Gordonia asplenii]NMO05090.1 hypothetical protein [Gordonia asplenii]